LLHDRLLRARATGAVFARTVVMPPWGLRLGGSIQLAVHAVTRGKAWLWLDDPADAVGRRCSCAVLVSRELTNVEPGQQTVLDRLLDVLLVLALRSDFRRSATAPRWYRASGDPHLHAALEAMHGDAGHSWTVPELAAISGLSRAHSRESSGTRSGKPRCSTSRSGG
jgi:hypothetical protein